MLEYAGAFDSFSNLVDFKIRFDWFRWASLFLNFFFVLNMEVTLIYVNVFYVKFSRLIEILLQRSFTVHRYDYKHSVQDLFITAQFILALS